jgi:hypothetical protein
LNGAVPPIHGMVLRAPAISLLISPGIAFGATIWQLQIAHCVVVSLIPGAAVMVARRAMSLPAAMAFGLALGASDLWITWSTHVLSEPIAAGMLLATIATLPAARRSVVGGIVFGLVVGLAWLARPNLPLILFAFAAATFLQERRRVLESRPLLAALGTAATLFAFVNLIVRIQSGFAPYAHYGLLTQATNAGEAAFFQKSWEGGFAYLAANADRVREALAASHEGFLDLWFKNPTHHFIGWLAVPAWVWVFARKERSFDARTIALSALGFLLLVLIFYGGNEPQRLSMPLFVCALYLVALMLGDLANTLAGRLRLASALPLIVFGVVFLVFPGRWASLPGALNSWERVQPERRPRISNIFKKLPSPLCLAMDKDSLVAAYNPWNIYLWCGNASIWLPFDLDSQQTLDAYLDVYHPSYIVSNPGPGRSWPVIGDHAQRDALLMDSERLVLVESVDGLAVYRVMRPPPGPPAWNAPPPLISIGNPVNSRFNSRSRESQRNRAEGERGR